MTNEEKLDLDEQIITWKDLSFGHMVPRRTFLPALNGDILLNKDVCESKEPSI